MASAIWSPAWYGQDQSLAIGQEDYFQFLTEATHPLFFSAESSHGKDYPMRARIDRICHPRLGEIKAIENKGLDYLFFPAGGTPIRVNAEENPGAVEVGSLPAQDWGVTVDLTPVPDETADTLAKAVRKKPLCRSAVSTIVKALLHPSRGLGSTANWILTAMGADALPELAGALDDPTEELRYQALRFIIALGVDARKTVPKLLQLVRSETGRVSFRAAQAASAAGCSEWELMSALANKSEHEQATIRKYLARS